MWYDVHRQINKCLNAELPKCVAYSRIAELLLLWSIAFKTTTIIISNVVY